MWIKAKNEKADVLYLINTDTLMNIYQEESLISTITEHGGEVLFKFEEDDVDLAKYVLNAIYDGIEKHRTVLDLQDVIDQYYLSCKIELQA